MITHIGNALARCFKSKKACFKGNLKHSIAKDPLYSCKLYRDLGCSHVDGELCDFPHCELNKKYLRGLNK